MPWNFYNSSGELQINDGGVSATAASITNDLTVTSGNVVIATAGKGIDFSAQASPASGMSSELLDHYEEGTWTPTVQDTSFSDSESQGYAQQVGNYVRIGKWVFLQAKVELSSLGSLTTSSRCYIAGLPFTPVNTSHLENVVTVGGNNLAISAGNVPLGFVEPNEAVMKMSNYDAAAGYTHLLLSEVSADGILVISVAYIAA